MRALVLAVGLLTAATTASAHHSIQAAFDISKTQTITGVVAKMDWRNPHAWLYVDVKDASGQVHQYSVEFGAANGLYRRGWRQEDLPVGAAVTISGYPARDGSRSLTANEVKLTDGRTLFGGNNPAN